MFLPREKKLLNLLFRQDKPLTTNEIANILHISSRTVKADIKKINQVLEPRNCYIITKTGVGLWLSYNHEGRHFLNQILNEVNRSSPMNPDMRKFYVAYEVLDVNDYIPAEKISQKLFVSRGTITNDLKTMERFFSRFNLTLDSKAKYGLRILGEEPQIRMAKAVILQKLSGSSGRKAIENVRDLMEDVNLQILINILMEAEYSWSRVLADVSFNMMIFHMAVSIRHSLKGLQCDYSHEKLMKLKDEGEWKMSKEIVRKIFEHLSVQLTIYDVAYLTLQLQGMDQKILKKNPDTGIRNGADDRIYNAMILAVADTERMFRVELSNDQHFLESLYRHLKLLLKRVENHVTVDNPILPLIKEKVGYAFEIAAYISEYLGTAFQCVIREDEIGSIALYVAAAFERRQAELEQLRPIVTLVCATGYGASQFMTARLNRELPELIIRKILPLNGIEKIIPEEQDFIISTVPMKLTGVDVISASPFIGEEEIKLIGERCQKWQQTAKLQSERYPILNRYLNDRITILQCDCKTKEEVITLLGGRLFQEKYVDHEYVDSVFKREELSSTFVGGIFAMPHAFDGHIHKQGIGLMTLKRPIFWEDEKVQIVFMLAIDSRSKKDFQGIFGEVSNMMEDSVTLEKILKADRFSRLKID